MLSRVQDVFRSNTPASIENNEVLSKLLQKPDQTSTSTVDGDQNQLKKIYFAEGYLAAKQTDGDKVPKFFKKLFTDLLVTVIILSIAIFILMGSSGSLIRYDTFFKQNHLFFK